MKLFPAQFDPLAIRFSAVDLTKVDPTHIGFKGALALDASLIPKIKTSDPTAHPLASVVHGFAEKTHQLNAPPDAVVSALDTLAFAPFASQVRELGGPRTPLQAKLLKNHEHVAEVMSDPSKLLKATGELIKTSAHEVFDRAKNSALAYLRPQAQVADWLLNTRWSAEGLAARRDEFMGSVKSGLAGHARETRAFARSLREGESEAFKGIGSFLAVAGTALINPNKLALGKLLEDVPQAKKMAASIAAGKPDKRAENFAKTMKKGWGEVDTRFLFPPEFGDQVLSDLKKGRFSPGERALVLNFPNPNAHGGLYFLSAPTVNTFKQWADYVLESSKDFIPASHKPKIGNLSLAWNFTGYSKLGGEKFFGHVDGGAFMVASTNLKDGQGTWIYPGQKLPKGATVLGTDQLKNPYVSPNGKTSIWSGDLRGDVPPTVHSSPLLELPEGSDRVTAILSIISGK